MLEWSERRWLDEVANGLTALRELDASCPTRMVYGADTYGRLSFGFITKRQPSSPKLSEAVEVYRHKREHDRDWLLLLTLVDQAFAEAFVQLCGHVYGNVSLAGNEEAGLTAAMECFEEWRQLFLGRQTKLSLEACRGLFAELSFGFQYATQAVDPAFVVECWQGPYGADQDFQFPGTHYEVKSRHVTSHTLHIASKYQLSGDSVVLVSVEVQDSRTPLPGFVSLPELVTEVRETLEPGSEGLANFDDALEELRFAPSDDHYSRFFFKCGEVEYFSVDAGFPRLTPQDLPEGIITIKYQLELEAISEYVIDSHSALNRMHI